MRGAAEVRIQRLAQNERCPKCNADAGTPCFNRITGEPTPHWTHVDRRDLAVGRLWRTQRAALVEMTA